MTPGGTRSGREFAHIHTEYKDDEHADVVVAKRRGEPWQAYQGGGQGSMHLCVSLRDAAEVVRSGWGEPHLLAGAQMGGGARLARGTLLLYAPRDETEVGVVLRVLQASLLYAQS